MSKLQELKNLEATLETALDVVRGMILAEKAGLGVLITSPMLVEQAPVILGFDEPPPTSRSPVSAPFEDAAHLSREPAVPATDYTTQMAAAANVATEMQAHDTTPIRFLLQCNGKRMDEIAAAMGTDAKSLASVRNELLKSGRIRTEGERRGTRYYRVEAAAE